MDEEGHRRIARPFVHVCQTHAVPVAVARQVGKVGQVGELGVFGADNIHGVSLCGGGHASVAFQRGNGESDAPLGAQRFAEGGGAGLHRVVANGRR